MSRASWRLALLSTLLALAAWRMTGATTAVQIAYVGAVESTVWRGIEQGWREANILGGYTGYTYHVQTMDLVALLAAEGQPPPATASAEGASLTAPPPATASAERPSLTGRFPMAVIAATDAPTLQRLSDKFATTGVAVLNLTADDEALRQACLPNLLHIAPSARMKADAVAQWQKKRPAAPVQARAWHEEYTKFAAGELNNRFRKAHGIAMDDAAWAGWAALKMLSEAVARAQTTEPARILTYLRNDLAFDGQKGVPQTFRDTGQLRQPILLVENGKLVGEAPVPGVVDSNDLDSLGRTSCK